MFSWSTCWKRLLEIEQEIDSKAYRSYEVGTALDKLSIIHASAKFFAASRRRWERRENLSAR
jgi:hypothetical protein